MSSPRVNLIYNRFYVMRYLLFPVIASVLFMSCHNQYRQEVMAGIQMNTICQIEENNHLVGHALSLDVSEDGSFIISNGSDTLVMTRWDIKHSFGTEKVVALMNILWRNE